MLAVSIKLIASESVREHSSKFQCVWKFRQSQYTKAGTDWIAVYHYSI